MLSCRVVGFSDKASGGRIRWCTGMTADRKSPIKAWAVRLSDEPIADPQLDLFGRWPLAQEIARRLLTLPGDTAHVIVVSGSWGSGKTSFLYLLRRAIECHSAEAISTTHSGGTPSHAASRADNAIVTCWYNPWWHSQADDVVLRLLTTMAATLARSESSLAQEVGRTLEEMARLMAPIAPVANLLMGAPVLTLTTKSASWIARLIKRLPTEKEASELSLYELSKDVRNRITKWGERENGRLIVFIDDVDRLQSSEIRDVVRAVRAVLGFPRTTFVLCMDRQRTVEALVREFAGRHRAHDEALRDANGSVSFTKDFGG